VAVRQRNDPGPGRIDDGQPTGRPLRRDPAQLERAFARLLLANPTTRILRFLDEDTDLPNELRLMATLPAAPYLRAATRLAARRVRRRG
jgi:hypothetical protein